jgi:hypothetical protein
MKVAGALLAAALLLCAGCASDGGAIGGAQYAPEYDYQENAKFARDLDV